MKYLSLLPLLSVLILSACAGDQPKQSGEEFEIRSATPGVVDHVIIKPKQK